MTNKIDILNNNAFTFNNNSLLYLKCKLNLPENQIFVIDPVEKIEGTIYIVVDHKNHHYIKKVIEDSPVIDNKVVVFDHFGNRLHILEKNRSTNVLGNVTIKTKSSPTLNNIIIPKHEDNDFVIAFSGSHFSENIEDEQVRKNGIKKDLDKIICNNFSRVQYYLNEKIIKTINNGTISILKKYVSNGKNVIEHYFGKSIKINDSNIHSIINIPKCKVVDIHTNIISGSQVNFTIRTNGIEIVANGTSEFQLLAFIESTNEDTLSLKIDDNTYETSKLTIKDFPGLDFEYVLKLFNVFKLINHDFFQNMNIENLTHEQKLLILDFIFEKINVNNSSEEISTKFFLETFRIILFKLKGKIMENSIFNCQSSFNNLTNLDNYQVSTNIPPFATCQRQYSVPFTDN